MARTGAFSRRQEGATTTVWSAADPTFRISRFRTAKTMNCRLSALTIAVGLSGGLGCVGSTVGGGPSPDAGVGAGGKGVATGVLATGQHMPSSLAVDGTNVYWVNLGTAPSPTGGKEAEPYTDGQVMKCAISGCDGHPTVLASGRHQAPSGSIAPFALGANGVYWNDVTPLSSDPTGYAHLFSCPLGGCTNAPTVLATGFAYALSVDRSSVYWTTYYNTQIMACSLEGCANPTTLASLASNEPPTGIAVDAANIYWAVELGGLMKCAIRGCSSSVTTLVTDSRDGPPITDPSGTTLPGAVSQLRQIALDDANVYIVDSYGTGLGRILKCAKNGCNNSPTTLASGLSGAIGIAVDADNVYWTETGDSANSGPTPAGAGRVAKCATGGCNDSPTVIAAHQDSPTGIAVDTAHVYWAAYGIGATDGTISVAEK